MSFSQQGRPISMTSTLGQDVLLIESFTGQESLSAPFQFHLKMYSENSSIDLSSLIRQKTTITLLLADGTSSYFSGMFNHIEQKGQGKDGLTVYEATVVPSIWFLSLVADCKIFQSQTVQDIVSAVLSANQVTNFRFNLNGTYPTRDYCVQYRETDLNFISRLLEDEGISYYFEYTSSDHTVVFFDTSASLPASDKQATARYSPMGNTSADEDFVFSLDRIQQVYTTKVTLTDYNFKTPSLDLKSNTGDDGAEIYDYPGAYTDRDGGERYSRLRVEERECVQTRVRGVSGCRAFRTGNRFTLAEHYRDDTNQNYVLVAIDHAASDTGYFSGQSTPFSYSNTFEAMPNSIKYRPPLASRKPVVQGSQTALVVGPSGEEIYVDSYGRVKVQFYWDRVGSKNETSSCWVRVSQIWAGKNWGWVTLPRIGQEVIVDFLEGDPDQPIVIGRVYNADQMPPYSLPDNSTQSGIKTRSSKNGGTDDFNEIRFEDLKGSEMITIHAQKDMETTVEHDDTQTIQHDRTIEVDGKHTETITGDTSIKIKEGNYTHEVSQGNETRKVAMGNQSFEVSMGNRSTAIKMGNDSTKLDLGKSETEAMQSITLTVGSNSIKIDQSGITLDGLMIKIQGSIMVQTSAPMVKVDADAMLKMQGGITMIN